MHLLSSALFLCASFLVTVGAFGDFPGTFPDTSFGGFNGFGGSVESASNNQVVHKAGIFGFGPPGFGPGPIFGPEPSPDSSSDSSPGFGDGIIIEGASVKPASYGGENDDNNDADNYDRDASNGGSKNRWHKKRTWYRRRKSGSDNGNGDDEESGPDDHDRDASNGGSKNRWHKKRTWYRKRKSGSNGGNKDDGGSDYEENKGDDNSSKY